VSKIIFGSCDADNGMIVTEVSDEDTHEVAVTVNVFGDGAHAFTTLTQGEVQALHLSITRYLGLPMLEVVDDG
jgi:hypothetical protein